MIPTMMRGLLLQGFALGWSVAWPPGPINAEAVRRSLSSGFWSAYMLCLGGCFGDSLWALAVALGAGAVTSLPGVKWLLVMASMVLLVVISVTFLRKAWLSLRAMRRGEQEAAPPSRLDGARGGFVLGLTLALSSPWNVAFWLAVMGRPDFQTLSLSASLLFAAAVIVGAATWGLLLCTAGRLGARFSSPSWGVVTHGLTGLLMLYFAGDSIWRMATAS